MDARTIEIATAFMAAPLEAGGWDAALKKMAHETGSARGQLVAFGHNHTVPFNIVTDTHDSWTEDFVRIDGGNPSINWRIASTRKPFEIAFERDYTLARTHLQSDIYDDFVQRYDMVNGCQTVLSQDTTTFFGLATLRTRSDGPTTETQRALFAELAPFALSAVKMQIALEHKGSQLVADAFDGLNATAFLLDVHGVVAARTNAATDFLNQPGCPLRQSGQQLTAARTSENRALQHGIMRMIGELSATSPRIFLSGSSVFDGHICEIFRLPKRESSFGYEPRALVVVRPVNRANADIAFLQKVMELTPAEADVARLMGEGLSREQVAAHRGTSVATVHAQLKSLFRKADVGREAEFVALVNRLLS